MFKIHTTVIYPEIKISMESDHVNYDPFDDLGVNIYIPEETQREFIKCLWKNKPEMIRDIICDGCPEIQ